MHNPMNDLKLGQAQAYVEQYDASLLQPVPRELSRSQLASAQFYGVDLWTAYELSWLSPDGKPQVAIAEFSVSADSANLIESKSFKYYLNSFNQTKLESREALIATLRRDLASVAGGKVDVHLFDLPDFVSERRNIVPPSAVLLDELALLEPAYSPHRDVLQIANTPFDGVWCSHLLKSNCPVTGQPDWASVWIGWKGRGLVPESLLRYLVSYRQHQDFHENCVERIFNDLAEVGQPEDLWVYARYTRRGGLDINPFRSSRPMDAPVWLAPRQ